MLSHKDVQGQFYSLFRSDSFATLPYIIEEDDFFIKLLGIDRIEG